MKLEQKARLITESQSLTEKIIKLQMFLTSNKSEKLEEKMNELLQAQLKLMKEYRDVINSRILLMMK